MAKQRKSVKGLLIEADVTGIKDINEVPSAVLRFRIVGNLTDLLTVGSWGTEKEGQRAIYTITRTDKAFETG